MIFPIKRNEAQCLHSLRITRPLTLFAELNDTALYGSQRQVLGHAVSNFKVDIVIYRGIY
ncbi:hypothetical protein BWD12_19280 [Leptospira santarosai serovar Bananal]|nr:hypothetical protein BWD11_17870 [Leptospira santarosai serovar Grippotyphosa]ONF76160.1 hypothetical protein BWD12_19280 [Leptospira santarosai serovar Bananal]